MDIEEQKYLTPAEVAGKHELFNRNEYLRLTGHWFTPLPCHFWELTVGMEIESRLQTGDKPDKIISGTITHLKNGFVFSSGICLHLREISEMRIKSFEVKNG